MIDGKPRFFVYYANSGNGIGVITADSPDGPWRSPIGTMLIDRNTPNCGDVVWLFDPGVLVDDDGQGYLFFGGGVRKDGPYDNTGQARRVKLGADMISIEGIPETWYVPYMFESSEIAKINGRYYYSYCTTGIRRRTTWACKTARLPVWFHKTTPWGNLKKPGGL